MDRLRWGLLSTASIGRVVVDACRDSGSAEFVAVASRDVDRARAFADEAGLARSFGSYEELLAAHEVDVVYVALPVSMHAEWTVNALEAGKHVLCEKPMAATTAQVQACFDAAERSGRRCVEGLMWRHHPQTQLARRLVADGAIGRLALVRAVLSVGVGPGDIRRSRPLDGGALNDLGCYCVSAIRLFAGHPAPAPRCRGRGLTGWSRRGCWRQSGRPPGSESPVAVSPSRPGPSTTPGPPPRPGPRLPASASRPAPGQRSCTVTSIA